MELALVLNIGTKMRYLTRQKSGIWQFRYQVPPKKRNFFNFCRQIKFSLHTRDRNVARTKSLKMELYMHQCLSNVKKYRKEIMLDMARSELFREEKPTVVDQLEYQELQNKFIESFKPSNGVMCDLVAQLINETIQTIKNTLNPTSKAALEESNLRFELKKMMALAEKHNGYTDSSLHWRSFSDLYCGEDTKQAAYDYIAQKSPLTYDDSSHFYSLLIEQLNKIFILRNTAHEASGNLDYDKLNRLIESLSIYLKNFEGKSEEGSITEHCISPVSVGLPESLQETANITELESYLSDYEKEKLSQGVKVKTVQGNISSIKVVLSLGGIECLKDISRSKGVEAFEKLKVYPSDPHHKKHKGIFEKLSPMNIYKKNIEVGAKYISEETATRNVQKTSSFFKWLAQYGVIDKNLFEGVVRSKKNSRKEQEKKRPFSPSDIKIIFSSNIYTEVHLKRFRKLYLNYQYWVPIIARYTGMRPNEICQLYKHDIVMENGIWCVKAHEERDDQSLKNMNSVRTIPIHSELIRLQFIQFVENQNDESRLFPELNYSPNEGYYSAVGSWFSRTFKEVLNFELQNKSFYSFRHYFINEFKQIGVASNLVGEIVGHIDQSITYDRYGSRVGVERLKDVIEMIPADENMKHIRPYY